MKLSGLPHLTRLLLATLAVAALAVFAAPPAPSQTRFTAEPQLTRPAWHPAYAAAFPGCHRSLPAHTIPGAVLLAAPDGMVTRVAFAQAWRSTHTRGNVAFVVGVCR